MTNHKTQNSKGLIVLNFVFCHLLLAMLICPSASKAEFFVGSGATGSTFLKIPIGARATSLAGAFTAVSADTSALEYNPAGLANLSFREVNLSLIRYIEDSKLQSAAVGFPLRTRLQQSKAIEPKIFFGGQYRSFKAEDDVRNNIGLKRGSFDIHDQLIHIAAAYKMSDTLSLGLGGKAISNEIQNESANHFALDSGLIWQARPHWNWGASILNMGKANELINEDDPLPLLVRVGTAYNTDRFLFLGDVSQGRDKVFQPAGAIEWAQSGFLKLRAGTFYHTRLEFTAGLGFVFSPRFSIPQSTPQRNADPFEHGPSKTYKHQVHFGLDYAFQTRSVLDPTHTITFKVLY